MYSFFFHDEHIFRFSRLARFTNCMYSYENIHSIHLHCNTQLHPSNFNGKLYARVKVLGNLKKQRSSSWFLSKEQERRRNTFSPIVEFPNQWVR